MISILGGGLSGLSAAFYLARNKAFRVSLYEASNRLGGWVKTEAHENKGFKFEQGPRTIRPKGIAGANTLELMEELNLPIRPILSSHPAALNRMVYAKNRLCMLPNSLTALFSTLPPFEKPIIRSLLHDLVAKKELIAEGDESMYNFVQRRFGKDIADYAISPMICGICAGDAKEISVRFLMNDIFEKEQRFGGVLKGMFLSKFGKDQTSNKWEGLFGKKLPSLYETAVKDHWSMYGIDGGLEKLPISLGKHVKDKNVDIKTSARCEQIIFHENRAYLETSIGKNVCKHVISSIPSFTLAKCVDEQHPELAKLLNTIPYVDVAVVNLQYPTKDLLSQPAFGFLVPPKENLPILGVIFDSCCFDMEQNTILTVMMGGKWFEKYFGDDATQRDILNVALKYVDQILKIDIEPKNRKISILNQCIPQYTVGHFKRVAQIRQYIAHNELPLSVCGAAYDGVGINDVILSARTEVEKLKA